MEAVDTPVHSSSAESSSSVRIASRCVAGRIPVGCASSVVERELGKFGSVSDSGEVGVEPAGKFSV